MYYIWRRTSLRLTNILNRNFCSMRFIFEDVEKVENASYNLEIENIIYNRANLDEEIVQLVAENFATNLIREFESNSKFIRDTLEIDDFNVEYVGFNSPSVLMSFSCGKIIDEDTLVSTIGRYTTKEYKEEFETDDGTAEIVFKPVRGELKVYLSSKNNGR